MICKSFKMVFLQVSNFYLEEVKLFPLYGLCFGILSKNALLNPKSQRLCFLVSLMVLVFIFSSMIYYELIFLCGEM